MDENAHKALLEQEHAPKRWIKTNPAGWFGYDPAQLTERLILVEGAFDRLTLLAAGFRATDVVALAGTAAQANWFPAQVQSVILALDADEGGTDAMRRLAERLERAGYLEAVRKGQRSCSIRMGYFGLSGLFNRRRQVVVVPHGCREKSRWLQKPMETEQWENGSRSLFVQPLDNGPRNLAHLYVA
jgi:hypothetical protein